MFMVCVTETHFRTFLVALTECDSRGVQVDVHTVEGDFFLQENFDVLRSLAGASLVLCCD